MERERFQAHVASLEQIVGNTHLGLKEVMDEFQDLCQRMGSERKVSPVIITEIRKAYKEIQDQLTKIRGINQILESKYRQYYHRDSLRDRELAEFAFLAKSLYSKFEFTLQEIEAKRKLKGGEERLRYIRFPWFQSRENQILLLQNLDNLNELAYEILPDSMGEEKRRVIQNKLRSVSLFVVSGDVALIDYFQSRMRLREYDIKERYAGIELRGALTHLRKISLSTAEGVLRRFVDGSEFSRLKCLLFSIQSQKDLGKKILGSTENILHRMAEGEVRTLSI